MKTRFLSTLTLFTLLLLGSTLFATNGMRMIGFGPVQRSMGGVGVGLTLDGASVLTNPGGMSDLGGRIDFGASYFSPSTEFKGTGGPGAFSTGNTTKSDKGSSPIPALGLIIPLNNELTFGIGAYGIAGMGVDYPLELYSSVTYTSYSQMRFAPGIAYKIDDMISFGVTANVMFATMEYNVALNAGMGEKPHNGSSAFGFGGTFGLKIKTSELFTIGLAYETKSYFQDFQFNLDGGVEKLEFNQPQNATLGFGVTPIKGLTFGLDIQWIRWSETNGENLPKYTQQVGALGFNMNWEDQLVFKFGIEYKIENAVTLRAGFNYGKMPLDEERAFENMAFPAVAEMHITGGLGFDLNDKMNLNLGFMYSPEAKISGANALQNITSYETKMSQYSLDFGIGYKF